MRCRKSSNLIYEHSHHDNRNVLDDYQIQPIEKLADGTSDEKRKRREEWWMKELKTLYPYGLNDRCNSNVFFSNFNDRMMYSIFNKQNKKEKRVEKKIDGIKTFIDQLTALIKAEMKATGDVFVLHS